MLAAVTDEAMHRTHDGAIDDLRDGPEDFHQRCDRQGDEGCDAGVVEAADADLGENVGRIGDHQRGHGNQGHNEQQLSTRRLRRSGR